MPQKQLNQARLVAENRRLQNAVAALLDELDGSGSPDLSRVRDQMPSGPPAQRPPWERSGYDSKQAWLDAEQGGGDGR